jgi:hypothetical protein
MAETEVESILREIRERVLSQQRTGRDSSATRSAMTNRGNGAGESEARQQITNDNNETLSAENLSLIESYLTTTARAWDRVPPLVSNRSGSIARVELWLKRQLKRATHWFTWEQVNFNAAVHQALRELLPVMAAQEHELQALRAQLAAQLAEQLAAAEIQQTELEALSGRTEARVAGLVNEMREGDAHLRDEQRVCLKQLALETSEAAVLEDRARRRAEALLEELKRRVGQLETDKK